MNTIKLHSINTGLFKLDGGAMFGVVPKLIWNKLNPADENNLCTWSMRSLLIEDKNRLILIDTGCGNKQSTDFFRHYHLHGDFSLEKSLSQKGFTTDDVTDVILTHLHFDHAGGAVEFNKERTKLTPKFKNATYWSNRSHWNWAVNPNAREAASFLKENFLSIQESGQLKFIDQDSDFGSPNFTFWIVNGHTEAMLIPKIKYKNTTVCFMADLIPSVGHIPLPYIAAYDVRPLDAMSEKDQILKEALERNYTLFFEHDPIHECGILRMTDKGIRIDRTFDLADVFKVINPAN